MNYNNVSGAFDEKDIFTYRKLMSLVPYNGIVAELGNFYGKSLCSVSDIVIDKKITVYAIDLQTYNPLRQEIIFRKNIENFKIKNQVLIIKSSTDEAVKIFPENYLDLVFIDANHTAPFINNDIKNWFPKLKINGILSGHDIDPKANWPDVKKAVYGKFEEKYINVEENIFFIFKSESAVKIDNVNKFKALN